MTGVRLSDRKGSTRRNNVEEKKRKAKLWLLIALLWPVILYAGLRASGKKVGKPKLTTKIGSKLRGQVKSLIQRWESTGYGPSKPRVAIVIVGNVADHVVQSVESVYKHTDRNRILCIVTVFDGMEESEDIRNRLQAVDQGLTAHSHNGLQHFHDLLSHHSHSKKLEVLFNPKAKGVSDSRRDGANFAKLLAEKYEAAGLKTLQEDILLLLLRPDSVLTSSDWVDASTAALIAPAPHTLANAVSFDVDYNDAESGEIKSSAPGLAAAFDFSLNPYWSKAPDYNAEDHYPSYTSPALSGAATAMRLQTFLDLPSFHTGLTTYFAADIDLALNLWLCADGIDVISAARAQIYPSLLPFEQTIVTDDMAARLVAAWMPQEYIKEVYRTRSANNPISPQHWDKLLDIARQSGDFPSDLPRKCRPFSWYADKINPDLKPIKTVEEKNNVNNVIKLKTTEKKKEKKITNFNFQKQKNIPHHNQIDPRDPKKHPIPQAEHGRLLSVAKLEILSHAHPISLAFQSFPVGHDYPHMGANDEQGNLGYIHNPTALKNNPPSFTFDKAVCNNKDHHYKMLTNKVKVDHKAHDALTKPVKIFCIVYTIEKNHQKIPSILQTWGQKCDGFMVASTKTDISINTVEISHQGPEEYNNIWQKVRSIWGYVYDNYYNDYDFFHIGGDDMYLLVENLRTYLSSDEIRAASNGGKLLSDNTVSNQETPLFLGRRFAYQGDKSKIFNSGGSGYSINKAALKALVTSFPTCFPNLKTFSEDTMVATCFRKQGIYAYETRDDNGGERYMPFAPGHHMNYRPPKNNPENDWYMNYQVDTLRVGYDHCAEQSVAFHYIKPDMMKRMHAILYGYCD